MIRTILVKDGKKFHVTLSSTVFSYTSTKKINGKLQSGKIAIDQMIALKSETTRKGDSLHLTGIILYIAKDVTSSKLSVKKLIFHGEGDTLDKLVKTIQSRLKDSTRPREVLVIINPNSGRKKAKEVFHKKVEPFFQLCGINSKVIVTERPKQAQEILQTVDLTDVDAVVTVGGDGIVCECLSGLVMRAQKDAGIDFNDPDAETVSSKIPIGIIPAGSGDCIVQYLHGSRDVMTAAIYIALGKTRPASAASIHQGHKLSLYSGLLVGFGLFGDIMKDCDKFRWMGASRFNIIPMATVLRRRMFDAEIEFLPTDSMEWQKLETEGKLYGVDTYTITRRAKDKDSRMIPCFGDDALTMFTTSKCKFSEHVRHLISVKEHRPDCFDFDFVKQRRVRGYRVKLSGGPVTTNSDGETVLVDKYYINCDGEVITVSKPEFEVRLHKHVIPLFGNLNE
ncbi:ceramide kinase-like [Gigantopelta aegis]|uniref:ceramide kinase-like n=1 Tax=Gigantopelta aegis TaxID=1735272 RepID=UPI001B888385|nr:ceramide kinase-like [Gigantopelta aegis]